MTQDGKEERQQTNSTTQAGTKIAGIKSASNNIVATEHNKTLEQGILSKTTEKTQEKATTSTTKSARAANQQQTQPESKIITAKADTSSTGDGELKQNRNSESGMRTQQASTQHSKDQVHSLEKKTKMVTFNTNPSKPTKKEPTDAKAQTDILKHSNKNTTNANNIMDYFKPKHTNDKQSQQQKSQLRESITAKKKTSNTHNNTSNSGSCRGSAS